MAKVIDELPNRVGGNYKYPLSQWLDGQVWELTQGVDYEDFNKFRSAAYAFGSRHHLNVCIRKTGPDTIAIQSVGVK